MLNLSISFSLKNIITTSEKEKAAQDNPCAAFLVFSLSISSLLSSSQTYSQYCCQDKYRSYC